MAMEFPLWFLWGVPAGALGLGLLGTAWAFYEVAKFDRKYGKRG